MCQLHSIDLACKGDRIPAHAKPFARNFTLILRRPDKPLPPEDNRVWGHYIKNTRMGMKMSTYEAAKALNVKPSAICRWEAQRSVPRVKVIPAIINFIGFVPMCRSLYQSNLGESFRAAREIKGLNQSDVTQALGFSESALRFIERGLREDSEKLDAIEDLLGIDVRRVFALYSETTSR